MSKPTRTNNEQYVVELAKEFKDLAQKYKACDPAQQEEIPEPLRQLIEEVQGERDSSLFAQMFKA